MKSKHDPTKKLHECCFIKNELDIIFENAEIGIIVIRNERIYKINKYGLSLFGYDNVKELKGHKKKILYPTNRDYIDTEHLITSILDLGEVYTGEHILKKKDSSIFWASLMCQSIMPKDSSKGTLCIFQDISSRKTHELELEKRVIERTEELELINSSLHQEINCRKHIENILTIKEEQLLTLINSTPDIICFKDGKGRWLECNDFIKNIFSFDSPDQWRGKSDLELSKYGLDKNKKFHYMCYETDNEVWNNNITTHVEETFLVNGISRIYDVIKVPVYHENGERKGLVVLGRDITERKEIETKLIENETKLSRILEELPIGVVVIDSKTKTVINVNPSACELLDCEVSKVLNNPCCSTICDKLNEPCPIIDLKQHVKNKELTIPGSSKILLKNASSCTIGINEYVIEVLTDITELKQSQKLIKSNEEKYKTIFNEAFDGILLIDYDTLMIQDVNESALSFFKYEKYEFLNLNISDLLVCQNDDNIEAVISQLKLDKEVYFEELCGIDSNGDILYFEIQCNVIEIEDKNFIYAILKDITEFKELEIKFIENRKQVTKRLQIEVENFQKELYELSSKTTKNLEESAKIIEEIKTGGDN